MMGDDKAEQTEQTEQTDDIVKMMVELKETIDRQSEEIMTLRKERSDLMTELVKTTPAVPREAPEDPQARYDAFKTKVLKKAYDIVQARM